MKFSQPAVLLAVGVSLLGAVVLVACGGSDDSGGSTTSTDAGSSADTSSGTSTDAGTTAETGATANDAGDAGDTGDGGLKALGQACTSNASCESNVCFMGGAGGGVNGAGNFCTIPCDLAGVADPICQGKTGLTGKCNGKKFCQAN